MINAISEACSVCSIDIIYICNTKFVRHILFSWNIQITKQLVQIRWNGKESSTTRHSFCRRISSYFLRFKNSWLDLSLCLANSSFCSLKRIIIIIITILVQYMAFPIWSRNFSNFSSFPWFGNNFYLFQWKRLSFILLIITIVLVT